LFSGVYRSTDGGFTWLKINNGLTTRAVTDLSLSSDGNHLYAATNGEGVFRLDLDGRPPAAGPTPQPGEPAVPATSVPGEAAATEVPAAGFLQQIPMLVYGIVLVLLVSLVAAAWLIRARKAKR